MGLSCNIQRKGRWIRGLGGAALLLAGVLMMVRGGAIGGATRWGGGGALAGLGAFVVFEAAVGWCAIRALGFRTPF